MWWTFVYLIQIMLYLLLVSSMTVLLPVFCPDISFSARRFASVLASCFLQLVRALTHVRVFVCIWALDVQRPTTCHFHNSSVASLLLVATSIDQRKPARTHARTNAHQAGRERSRAVHRQAHARGLGWRKKFRIRKTLEKINLFFLVFFVS